MDIVYWIRLIHRRQFRVITDLRIVVLLTRPPFFIGKIVDGKIEVIPVPCVLG